MGNTSSTSHFLLYFPMPLGQKSHQLASCDHLTDLADDSHFLLSLFESDAEKEEQTDQIAAKNFPVSDAKYAHGLQLQEALMGSSAISTKSYASISSSSSSPPSITMRSSWSTEELLFKQPESGESSHPFCEICAERKETDQMFRIQSCSHSFCSDCISKHVTAKIQGSSSNNSVVTCLVGMDCKAVLELEACRAVLPKAVLDLWEDALCQELIDSTWLRYYCPYKDCSALLVYDKAACDGEEVIRESECPFCHRLFCAQCNVAWHAGVGCDEFQRLNEDERGREDIMLVKLARDQKWSRCPNCKFYVERTQGCPHMVCRCRFEFCYGCGSQWTSNHGGCSRD